jgi:hypothetical protein
MRFIFYVIYQVFKTLAGYENIDKLLFEHRQISLPLYHFVLQLSINVPPQSYCHPIPESAQLWLCHQRSPQYAMFDLIN